jgi:hypothetical protein
MDRAPRHVAWREAPARRTRPPRAAPRRGTRAPALRGVLAALTAALALAAGASSASAVIVQLRGRTLSYQPLRGSAPRGLDEFFSNLDYNGGPVMASNTNYPVYWEPSGSPAYPADYQPGINRFFEDLAHDSGGVANVESVSAQYNDGAGEFAAYSSHFGGPLIDTDPYPANGCTRAPICLSDTQLRAELKKYLAAHGLPTDLAHEYFLLTPPGVEDCFSAAGSQCSAGSHAPAYCAYHGSIAVTTGVIVYASDPYVSGNALCDTGNHPNGTSSDGALIGGLSHEHNESITDPEPNSAWTDIGGSGGEIGDKCRTFNDGTEFGTPLGKAGNGASYNQLINGDLYWYQQEWSNQTNSCLQRLSFSGEEPTATFTSKAGAGNEVSFDASGSTAPGGVARYNWQFNDGPGLAYPTETTGPTVSHTFPTTDHVYTVALTVFSSDGTSIGTSRSVVVGTIGAPTVAKVVPNKGPVAGGTSVTITGLNLSGASAVRFGTVNATKFVVKSSTSIVAVSPAETPRIADVTVTAPGGTSAVSTSDRFRFVPTVTNVSPKTGSVAGGTTVTVSGTGFAPGTTASAFKFGTAKATGVNCASSTTCTVVVPKHEAATVDVLVTVNKVSSVKSPPGDRFTYS